MIISDIDGCIFNNVNLIGVLPDHKNSSSYSLSHKKASPDDKPILPVINFVKYMSQSFTQEDHRSIVFVTSRREDDRAQTAAQLYQYFSNYKCKLHMREMEDTRDTISYKRETFNQLSRNFHNGSIIIDHHPSIIEMVSIHFPLVNRLLVPNFGDVVLNSLDIN